MRAIDAREINVRLGKIIRGRCGRYSDRLADYGMPVPKRPTGRRAAKAQVTRAIEAALVEGNGAAKNSGGDRPGPAPIIVRPVEGEARGSNGVAVK